MSGSIGAVGRANSTARQNTHPLGKPEGLSLSDLKSYAEPAASLTELAYFAFGQLRQRLAYHLLALTAEQDGSRHPVHLAHLATAVGSSREMVSRTLAPLAADGTLHTDPAGVTVTDRYRLRDHANLD